MTNLLYRNGRFVTVHRKCSKIPPSSSMHFATRVFFIKVDVHICLCGQQHPKCQRSIRVLYQTFFFTLRSSSNNTNKTITDSNSCLSVNIRHYTQVYMHFFLTVTDSFTSQNIDLSSRKSLYGPTLYTSPNNIPIH
jgi:hypothetical protein